MVTVVATKPLNFSELDITLDRLGFLQSVEETEGGRSETSFTKQMVSLTYNVKGVGFTYDSTDDRWPATGGTIKEVEVISNSTSFPLNYKLTGLSVTITESSMTSVFNYGFTLFGGDDSFTGSTGNDGFRGYNGKDTLRGNAGDDQFEGGAGDDTIYGGIGKDSLNGGSDKDKFVFDTSLNAKTNVDTIVGFVVADDTIVLSRNVFLDIGIPGQTISAKALEKGKKADDKHDRIIYDKKSGNLSFDDDGKGGHKQVLFAKIDPKLKVTADDFLVA